MSALVHDLVVVGAGITGLSVAWRARRAGRSVLLLEASPRVGGVIRTERVGGYRVERAAATFPSSATALLELASSLPTPPTVRTPPPEANGQWLWTNRGLLALPRTPPALLRSPFLPFRGKVRLFAELLRGPRRVRTPESAYGFVRRRFGRDVAERLLRPMTLGIYGTRPEDLGLADAFPMLADMERASGSLLRGFARRKGGGGKRTILVFEDGMEALPRAVAAALGDAVRVSTPVVRVSKEGELLRVATSSGDPHLARRVVLATTAGEQARLVEPFSTAAAETLSTVAYVPMVVVAVGLPPGGAPPLPKGFGFLRGAGAKGRVLGASFPSCWNPAVAPAGHELVTVFAGGGADPAAADLSDDEIARVVERDLATALGGPVRPDLVSICRWPRAIPVLSPGHRARMASAQALLSRHGLVLSGSHLTGVGVHACAAAAV